MAENPGELPNRDTSRPKKLTRQGGNFAKRAPSAMVREIPESEVPRRNRLLISCAILGIGALTLAGCGRKGALDPPPGGYALEPTTTAPGPRPGGGGAPRPAPA